jgi:hypothetical protein
MDGTVVEARGRMLALMALLMLVALCAAGALSVVLSGYSWV